MEKNIEFIGEELFNKIRSRFPEVTLGDSEGLVTNDPKEARFFDFEFDESAKISVSINKESLDVIYSNTFLEDQGEIAKNKWFGFLKELRQFAKKRLLNFDVRNITKNNLDRRDYSFMAQEKFRESTMTESRLYGTARNSFQNIGSAKIHIKHSHPVNTEISNGRTQYIESIYIENDNGERFKYPYRHLNGARAAARHIAEGGNMYDDFGKHITGLSEELNQLRKFKVYVGKNSFMAENMSPYMSTISERITGIKSYLVSVQRPAVYKSIAEKFIPDEMVAVPEDISKNWIDKLTIKQFNEELEDVFPYIYKLVAESNLVTEINPEDIVDEEIKVAPRNSRTKVDEFEKWATEVVDSALETEDEYSEGDPLKAALEKIVGSEIEVSTSGASGFQKKMYHLSDDLYVTFNDKSNLGDIYVKGKNIDSFRGIGNPDMEKLVKKYAKKYGAINKETFHSHEEQQIPVTEYVLSMYDRESGRFPKGETSVLTGVEKEYGEQYVRTAEAFINAINEKFREFHTQGRGEYIQPDTGDLGDIVRLSGLG